MEDILYEIQAIFIHPKLKLIKKLNCKYIKTVLLISLILFIITLIQSNSKKNLNNTIQIKLYNHVNNTILNIK